MKWLGKDTSLDFSLGEDEVLGQLPAAPSEPLLFGHISPSRISADLRSSGISAELQARGYAELLPRLHDWPDGRQRLQLLGRYREIPELQLLVDLRCHSDTLELGGRSWSALGWDWLEMEDPMAVLAPGRSLLPGQRAPGLGIYRQVTSLMLAYTRGSAFQAVAAHPSFFHNAVLYHPVFRFSDPRCQGQFLALRRDLLPLGLAAAAWALERGEVQGADGKLFGWPAGEMVQALHPDLRQALHSPSYEAACCETRESLHFRLF